LYSDPDILLSPDTLLSPTKGGALSRAHGRPTINKSRPAGYRLANKMQGAGGWLRHRLGYQSDHNCLDSAPSSRVVHLVVRPVPSPATVSYFPARRGVPANATVKFPSMAIQHFFSTSSSSSHKAFHRGVVWRPVPY